jgi:hypothetical protein
MWSFRDRKIMDFCADDAKKLKFNTNNKLVKKQLRNILKSIKYNSMSGDVVKYGWFYGDDDLYPQVREELKSRGFVVESPVKEKLWHAMIEEFCPYTSVKIVY